MWGHGLCALRTCFGLAILMITIGHKERNKWGEKKAWLISYSINAMFPMAVNQSYPLARCPCQTIAEKNWKRTVFSTSRSIDFIVFFSRSSYPIAAAAQQCRTNAIRPIICRGHWDGSGALRILFLWRSLDMIKCCHYPFTEMQVKKIKPGLIALVKSPLPRQGWDCWKNCPCCRADMQKIWIPTKLGCTWSAWFRYLCPIPSPVHKLVLLVPS